MPFHSWKLALFTLLSLADLSLTWYLLRHSDGAIYEGNPVARQFLDTYGWAGLAAFKAAAVLLCAGVCLTIARRRPRTAGRVLAFGCATLTGVVLYSCCLSGWVLFQQEPAVAALEEQDRQLDCRLRNGQEYHLRLNRLSEDLIAGRRTLPEAVRLLGETAKGRDEVWLASLRDNFNSRSDEEALAANLFHYSVLSCRDVPARAWEVAGRLEVAFRAAFGTLPPRHYRHYLAARWTVTDGTGHPPHQQPRT
jgi:hypothetical protein